MTQLDDNSKTNMFDLSILIQFIRK